MQAVIVSSNEKRMGEIAGQIGILTLENKPPERDYVDLYLATGGSPLPVYDYLKVSYRRGRISFNFTRTRNLDEYVIRDRRFWPFSYKVFMKRNFFDAIDINPANTCIPNALARDPDEEANYYEKLNEDLGPTQVTYCGVGPKTTHIAFCEPPADINSPTHVQCLDIRTRKANARFVNGNVEMVPEYAITVGIGTIRKYSNTVVLLTTGNKQNEVTTILRAREFNPNAPGTALRTMPYALYCITKDDLMPEWSGMGIEDVKGVDRILIDPTDDELRDFLKRTDFINIAYAKS